MRKPKPLKVWRSETYGLEPNHTSQTFNPKLAALWKPRAPYADWAPPDSYSELWEGTITWRKVDNV